MAPRQAAEASGISAAKDREAVLRAEMRTVAEGLVRAIDAGRSPPAHVDVEVAIALQHTDLIAVADIPADIPRDNYAGIARMYVLSDYLDAIERIFAGTLKAGAVPAFARELMVFAVLVYLEARQIELHKAGALIAWLHQQERALPYQLRGRAGGAKRKSRTADIAMLWAKLEAQGKPERERVGIIAARTGLTDRAVRKTVTKRRLRRKVGT